MIEEKESVEMIEEKASVENFLFRIPLGTIHNYSTYLLILGQHNFGLFLTYPPTMSAKYTVLNVKKIGLF